MKFADYSFLPIDRPYNFNQNGKITYPFSLGACSYSGEIEIDVARNHPSHLLVGRFCSFAGKIWFSVGNNHEYRNTVTTFPFGMDFVVERILNAAKIPPINYVPVDRGALYNHFQTIVGNDVWIGERATIRGGVKIGSGAIIGTNAMVAKDIPPYAIAVGNPARVVKYRFDAATIRKFMAVKWWNWSVEKIYQNFPLMRNAEDFLARHYTPELERIPYEKIGGGVGSRRISRRGQANLCVRGRFSGAATALAKSYQRLFALKFKKFCADILAGQHGDASRF